MPSPQKIIPVNMEWLKDVLPMSAHGDRGYLATFYNNILYYPPKTSKDQLHSTVMSILQCDPVADFADSDMTTSPEGIVTYHQALYAIERQRQLYYCDRRLLISIGTILADNWDHVLNTVPKAISPASRTHCKVLMEQASQLIFKGLQRDHGILEAHVGERYYGKNNWTKGYGGSQFDSSSKAYWLLDCIDALGEMSVGLVDLLLQKDGMIHALVSSLTDIELLWKKRSVSKMPSATRRYRLFTQQMYKDPTKTEMIALDGNAVKTENFTDRDTMTDQYNIVLQPAVGSERITSWQKEDWLGMSNIQKRAKEMSIFVAYNIFNSAYSWLREWGNPDSTPVTLADLKDYRAWSQLVPDINTYFIRHQRAVELTVAQYSQMVKELSGHTPDFKAKDFNPMTGETSSVAKEDATIPDEGRPLEQGEVPGGLEEPDDDDDTLRGKLKNTYASKVVTVPQTKEQKEKEDSESNGNWMILILAAVGAVAFMR